MSPRTSQTLPGFMFMSATTNKQPPCIWKTAIIANCTSTLINFRRSSSLPKSFQGWDCKWVCARIFWLKTRICTTRNMHGCLKSRNTRRARADRFERSETEITRTCTARCQFRARPVLTRYRQRQGWGRRRKKRETFWQETWRRGPCWKRSTCWRICRTWSLGRRRT